MNLVTYRVIAVAYGEGSYSTEVYNSTTSTQEPNPTNPTPTPGTNTGTTQDTQTGAPNTGLFQEPSFMIPLLLGLAIIIGSITFLISKALRKRKIDR